MISLVKKIAITFVMTALLFIVGDIFLINKGESASSLSEKSSSLKLLESALANKLSKTHQPVQKKSVQKQPIKLQTKEQKEVQQVQKQPVLKKPVIENSKILNVPLINQLDAPQLYNGCEVTSLAMILIYNGYHVTKNELAHNIATVPLTYQNGLKGNPNEGFVGNMEAGPGYAVYSGPVYNLARKYAGSKAVDLTNSPFSVLLTRVSQGEPVWIITTETFAPVSDFKVWHTPQGIINITFSEHSVVMTGYDENYIYINNPYGQKNEKVNRSTFEEAWEQMGKQAIVIQK